MPDSPHTYGGLTRAWDPAIEQMGTVMTQTEHSLARLRTRWSAIGAAVAITLGAGGIGFAQAAVDSGDKPITVTVDSKRILDTRINLGLAGGFAKDTPREVQVTGAVDVATDTGTAEETVVPDGATAVLVNVTVVFPTDQGFLTLRAGGATGAPSTSTVNFQAGSVEPNAATVDLSADGKVQVWVFMPDAAAKADVLIDVVGYTVDHNHDDRYYTKADVDALLAAKADKPTGTSSIRLRAAAFSQGNSAENGVTYYWQNNFWVTQSSTGACFVAPVTLPAGATVTGVSATLQKVGAGDIDLRLVSYSGTVGTEMANITDTGTGAGVHVVSTSSITDPVVATSKDYAVHYCLTATEYFVGATIDFTYPD